jgi:hypothetical protein
LFVTARIGELHGVARYANMPRQALLLLWNNAYSYGV